MLFAQFRGAVGCGPIPTWLEKDSATILGSPLRAKGGAQEPQLDPAQLQHQVHISTAHRALLRKEVAVLFLSRLKFSLITTQF